ALVQPELALLEFHPGTATQLHPHREHRSGGLQAAQSRHAHAIGAPLIFKVLVERNRLATVDPGHLPHVTHHLLPSMADGFANSGAEREDGLGILLRNIAEPASERITKAVSSPTATTGPRPSVSMHAVAGRASGRYPSCR